MVILIDQIDCVILLLLLLSMVVVVLIVLCGEGVDCVICGYADGGRGDYVIFGSYGDCFI